jgi:hypothetical protein
LPAARSPPSLPRNGEVPTGQVHFSAPLSGDHDHGVVGDPQLVDLGELLAHDPVQLGSVRNRERWPSAQSGARASQFDVVPDVGSQC